MLRFILEIIKKNEVVKVGKDSKKQLEPEIMDDIIEQKLKKFNYMI